MHIKHIFTIVLFSIPLGAFGDALTVSEQDFVRTQYFTIAFTEYLLNPKDKFLNNPKVMGGGSFTVIPNDQESILYATADSIFYKININEGQYQKFTLIPNLELGHDLISKSTYISGYDTLPRLLDIAIHNEYLYATYNCYDSVTDRIYFKISRISFSQNRKIPTPNNWSDIYISPPLTAQYFYSTNGGKMQFTKNLLYFTVGDQELEFIKHKSDDIAAQNPSVPWGKVMVMNLDEQKTKIYSYGHRNQQGLLIDSHGIIYAPEHGPRGGDELNQINFLNNYGWPFQSYGTQYDSYKKIGPKNYETKFTQPIFVFTPAIAPSQLIESVNFADEWKNNFLLGSLKAMSLYRMVMQKSQVLYIEPIYIGKRVRDLKEIGNNLILLTDDKSFIKLSKTKIDFQKVTGQISAINRCAGCHNFGSSKNTGFIAPSLSNIIGKKVGGSNFFGYSKALITESKKNTLWTDAKLIEYLKDPQKLYPGTSMPNLNLNNDQIQEIVKALKLYNQSQE